MNKTEFERMIASYIVLQNTAKNFTGIDLATLPIAEYNEKVEAARKCQKRLDAFDVDIYHVIGMGNLSASQMAKFSKVIKDINCYRTAVKIIAGHTTVNIAKAPAESTYKLSVGVKLTAPNKL